VKTRVAREAAVVLHVRPYRETSLLIDLMSHRHGRIAAVARGARRARRGHELRPFCGIEASWVASGGLATLTGHEGRHGRWFTGNALACAYYVAELVMRLTREREPHQRLFESVEWVLEYLGEGHALDLGLREFERVLLEELGYGLDLLHEAGGAPIEQHARYWFEEGRGLVRQEACADGELPGVEGATLIAIANRDWQFAGAASAARRLFASCLAPLLGPKPLMSRALVRRELPW
jgi:DNA repair protein RecO (recombination protein O)